MGTAKTLVNKGIKTKDVSKDDVGRKQDISDHIQQSPGPSKQSLDIYSGRNQNILRQSFV